MKIKMRKIILIALAACAVWAAGCGVPLNPIGNPIHGPAVSDCHGTHNSLTHHVIGERDHIGLVTGHVVYVCDKIPRLFRLQITIQNRRPGKVRWHDISEPATAEFSEAFHPRLGHPYLLVTRFECHGPYTRFWRLKQVYSGESSTGEVVPPITVYYPGGDPLEQGLKIRCGETEQHHG